MPTKTYYTNKKHHKTKHAKHYKKVYWPYLPLLLVMVLSIFAGIHWHVLPNKSVLGYATQLSRSELLKDTNQQRQSHSEAKLTLDTQLNAAAQAKAEDMAKRDYWSHIAPDGTTPWVFISRTGYTYKIAGENLAYGFATSADTVTAWMNSPEHRANILNNTYQNVGFGFANAKDYQQNGPATIVVAMYAAPASATVPAAADNKIVTDAPSTALQTHSQQAHAVKGETEVAPGTVRISRIQTLTGGTVPWASFAIGMSIAALGSIFILRHALLLGKVIRYGEVFVLHHPYFDLGIVVLITMGMVLTSTVGFIR